MPIEMLMHRSQWMDEESTWYYTYQLRDELGNPTGLSSLDTVTLTVYSRDTVGYPVILDWDAKTVKTANGGTITSTGKFEFRLPAVDAVLLDPTRSYELRGLLLTWTTLTGKVFRHEVHTAIANIAKVS